MCSPVLLCETLHIVVQECAHGTGGHQRDVFRAVQSINYRLSLFLVFFIFTWLIIAVFSHSEGREGEPPPRQGSQRDLDHYVTVLLAGVWRRGSVVFRILHPCDILRPRSPTGETAGRFKPLQPKSYGCQPFLFSFVVITHRHEFVGLKFGAV